jgi:hypothetical protein
MEGSAMIAQVAQRAARAASGVVTMDRIDPFEGWEPVSRAAELSGYSAGNIRRLARDGIIRSKPSRNGYWVYMADVWAYVKEQRGPYEKPERG